MKNLKHLGLGLAALSLLFFTSCKDETTDPVDGGGTTAKTCKITKLTDDDAATTTYTYDGDNLVKIVEDDDGDVYTTDFNYVGGELTEVVDDDGFDITTYKVIYTDGKISRVDIYLDGMLDGYFNVTLNADGTLAMVDEFYTEDPDDVLTASYEYTYANGDLESIKNIEDSNDDGMLVEADDDVIVYTINALDGKKNPLYGLPTYITDFSDVLALTKSNVNAMTLMSQGVTLPFAITYMYNEDDYPTQFTATGLGDTVKTDVTLMCE